MAQKAKTLSEEILEEKFNSTIDKLADESWKQKQKLIHLGNASDCRGELNGDNEQRYNHKG